MVGDFFEELICVANLNMVRSVSVFCRRGIFKYLYDISLSKTLDFDRCISIRVNHEQESWVPPRLLFKTTLTIGHKIGKERL